MRKSRTVPLARGLIAGEKNPIYGQLEISLINDSNIQILIQRKPYSGHSDIRFSIPYTSLQSIVDVLHGALEKLDDTWLSRIATKELEARHRTKALQAQKTKGR
jgi:bisphosphoglycerate-dependent phosphoglycerate mutase